MHYFSKNIGNYRRRAHALSLLEHGVYNQLIDEYYLTEQPLSKDIEEVCDEIGARSEDEKKAVEKILRKFFKLTAKGYRQEQCDEKITAYKNKAATNKVNGKKGGRPKKGEEKTQTVKTETQTVSESKGNQEPRTNNQEQTTTSQNKFEEEDMKVAKLIYFALKEMNENQKEPNFKVWAMDVNKMNRIDNRSHAQIKEVFYWANEDEFWCTNILSPSKLRKQFDTLLIKMGAVVKKESKLMVPPSDDDLWPWAEKNGFPRPLPNETYSQYRSRLKALVEKKNNDS